MTATIWRTCPSCGSSFEQPDDPGRKRIYCSRACQQAAYRARQRTSAGQHSSRQDRRQDWRSERHEQRRQRPAPIRPAPASATVSTPAGATSASRRHTVPTASGPAPEAVTTWPHPAHHRRLAGAARPPQLPAQGGRLPGEGRGSVTNGLTLTLATPAPNATDRRVRWSSGPD
jgi:hypothetical protein